MKKGKQSRKTLAFFSLLYILAAAGIAALVFLSYRSYHLNIGLNDARKTLEAEKEETAEKLEDLEKQITELENKIKKYPSAAAEEAGEEEEEDNAMLHPPSQSGIFTDVASADIQDSDLHGKDPALYA